MTPFKFEQLPTELQQKVLFDAILSSEPLFYFNPPNEVTDSKLAKRPQCLRTRFNLIMSLVLVNKSLCLNMFEVLKIVMAENDKTMARLYSALPMASTQTHKAQEAYDCLAVTYHLPLSLFPAQALKVIHRRKWRNRKQKGKVMDIFKNWMEQSDTQDSMLTLMNTLSFENKCIIERLRHSVPLVLWFL